MLTPLSKPRALRGRGVLPGAHTRLPSPSAGSGRAVDRVRADPPHSPILPSQIGNGAPVKQDFFLTLASCHDLSPKSLPCRRGRGSTICCPFMGTPALERLWQTCKCSQLVAVYSVFHVCNPISMHIYRIPHLLSKSESQVDDYPIFTSKEPSVF